MGRRSKSSQSKSGSDQPGRREYTRLAVCIALMVATAIFIFSGCSSVSDVQEKLNEGKYLAFISGKFNTMSQAADALNTQLKDFNEDKLNDADWVSKTEGYMDTIKSGCGDIINYQNVPTAYADIHSNLVTLAGQVQSVMDQYKTGIDNKDFNTLAAANQSMASLSTSIDTYVQQLKGLLDTTNQ